MTAPEPSWIPNLRPAMTAKFDCSYIPHKRLTDFVKNTVPGKCSLDRTLWIVVHFAAVTVFFFMIYDTTRVYRNTPIATHMTTDMYPISQVDFPAVVICNINIISKRKAQELLEEIWQREWVRSLNLTRSRILELIRYVGHLYTFSIDEVEEGDIVEFHTLLMTAFNKTFYNVDRLVRTVSVQCNQYIIRCQWEGVVRTCADILEPRHTPDGNCCAFNYARWRDHFTSNSEHNFAAPIEKSESPGSDFGLWLLLDVDEEDYFYQLFPSVGFKVTIYTPTNYPDIYSGNTRECIVGKGTETLLNIGASVLVSNEDIINVDMRQRKCLFKSEYNNKFGGQSSFSDCIMHCRVQDIVEKCKCIPFFYPMPSGQGEVRRCNFADLECLHMYQYRWRSITPFFDVDDAPYPPGTFSEVQGGHLNCGCYPTCTNTEYTISESFGNMRDDVIIWDTNENGLNRTADHVVINVYFGGSSVLELQHDVQYYWYELMSHYGGLCNMFLGLSLMSVIEWIYKCFKSIFTRRKKAKRDITRVAPARGTMNFRKRAFPNQDSLIYWREIDVKNLDCHQTNDLGCNDPKV